MPVPSKFSNGFGKAITFLDYQEGQAFIPNQQEYKYKACAVIDETTGKSMEYRDLVKDPKNSPEQQRMNLDVYSMEQARMKMVPKE